MGPRLGGCSALVPSWHTLARLSVPTSRRTLTCSCGFGEPSRLALPPMTLPGRMDMVGYRLQHCRAHHQMSPGSRATPAFPMRRYRFDPADPCLCRDMGLGLGAEAQ